MVHTFSLSTLRVALLAAFSLTAQLTWAASSIVRDGSLGTGSTTALVGSGSVVSNGVTYSKIAIPESYGQRSGGNVFHSFGTFNVGAGDAAVFGVSGPTNNVISRVTGGNLSTINGLISLDPGATGSSPNLFLINPAGVTFGAGAAIDVPAAFHVGTADYVRFGDGNFYANPATASTLSIQSPVAFGFLGGTPGNVGLDAGAMLGSMTGAIDIVAGDVSLRNATLGTMGQDIRIVALGHGSVPREVATSGNVTGANGTFQGLSNSSITALAAGSQAGGNILVAAGSVELDASTIWSQSLPDATGQVGNVEVIASGNIQMRNGGQIGSATASASNAGDVSIQAANIDISGFLSGIFNEAQAGSGGAGVLQVTTTGDVTLHDRGGIDVDTYAAGHGGAASLHVGGALSLLAGGYVDALSTNSGNAGSLDIAAASLLIDQQASTHGTGMFAYAYGTTGRAGTINIRTAGDMAVRNGGVISTATYVAGDAGDITIHAGNLTLNALDSTQQSYIGAFSAGEGSGGAINVTTSGALNVMRQGALLTASYASGNAGSINVHADSVTINAGGEADTGFISKAYASGNAGNISLHTGSDVHLFDGGVIDASSFSGPGNAGNIQLIAGGTVSLFSSENYAKRSGIYTLTYTSGNAGSISVDASHIDLEGFDTGIYSYTSSANYLSGFTGVTTGNGGSIALNTTGTLSLLNGGNVDSSSYSLGNGGAIHVNAGAISANGLGNTAMQFTGITSSATSQGNGGEVTVRAAGDIQLVGGAQIASGSYGAGSVMPVHVTARNVWVDGNLSGIGSSTDTAASGSGGAVEVTALENILVSNGGYIGSGTQGSGDGGAVNVMASGDLTVRSGGYVTAGTIGSGAAGNLSVSAKKLWVDGRNADRASSISATAGDASSGRTGNLTVRAADSLTLSNGGQLTIQNDATVGAPSAVTRSTLSVNAASIVMKEAKITAASTGNMAAGSIDVHFGQMLNIDPSSITTSANSGNGGSILIAGNGTVLLDHSQITTSVTGGSGNGGDISIQANALVMNSGFIQANTAAASAVGGAVNIDVNALIPTGNSLFLGGSTPYTFQPDVFGFNVIQAAAPTGLGGNVQVTSPALDLSGKVTPLKARSIGSSGVARSPCQATGGSSLAQSGRGGFAPRAGNLLGPQAPAIDALAPVPVTTGLATSTRCAG